MRFIKIFLFLSIIFQTSTHTSYALSPTPDLLPDVLKRSCGIADDPDANRCCEPIDFNKKIVGPVEDILNSLPDSSGSAVGEILNKVHDVDPISSRIEMRCYSGFEKNAFVTNPNTGLKVKRCICTTEDFVKQQEQVNSVKLEIICQKYIKNLKEHDACIACAGKDSIMTGIGCVPTKFSEFVTNFLLSVGIGFAGMFSLGCIIYSAIMIQTSQGNAEKISQSQDQIKACIFGLLMVMFSILLLRIIGVNILNLPGFL